MDPKKIGNAVHLVALVITAVLGVLVPTGVIPADWLYVAAALGLWSTPTAAALGGKIGGDK